MKSLPAHHDLETLTALVEGRVQGVGFRAATVRQAHLLKLGGWVRNLADGRVEVLIQGEHTAIDQMLSWLLQGPPAARVTGVSHVETRTERHYERFEQI
ncbi:MAG: acylphosphatase [Castellaniella sp.]|uniref:acylphosphatase n=1 Tax=Castellaniella sp. TaxID=1955812 RepID=UPI003A8BC528